MQRIKKGDDVVVRSGKDAGKRGTVQRVLPGENGVVVAGANMVKRHVRPNPHAGVAGGIQEREATMDLSKVNPFCKSCNKGVRVGFKTLDDGRKVRVCRTCGESLDS
ncbi:MAG TPA: 50S ribosomal protein L24 [Gammaproteobacteria bacterium]|nr:50S ribosomal protein L24 [Gammaproteobacteria bacterium]